jgi:hypothetical protein
MLDAAPLTENQFAPGQIGRIDGAGMVIGASDGALIVRTLRLDPDGAGPAAEVAALNAIMAGAELQIPD